MDKQESVLMAILQRTLSSMPVVPLLHDAIGVIYV